ncbi:tRNA (5-methylaminomethyl-2-thiouridylate)-methyltransferase [Geoalkalibacter ferrihydriticus]|uniref:tRNA-specific 2-thiouridylase MnmA n=2 Tax=Geoalkalibacter ferrihydriticus TaxID=392333 RepID=A0A0C2HP42_9BACT|nr:tRNA 2-thiouridine(34) synthase MnmA [Geoalkalibacter ferrihydriticus]KIH76650.1 thiouridylase [Geoalkalibacter ferrihydriticus DSM 17813]SDM04996.1 tRNA (5-methylaminomethyl-2-thiouridylate)-methyltransferase [Geoalkalibacter ferrihydriticus]
MTTFKKRIVVAMSGGVDSSVAAALLKEQGHEVIGMTMQIWDYSKFTAQNGETFGSCCSLDDVYDARRVAQALDIPFYVVNFEKQFQQEVIDDFCDAYFSGRTPNPCVLCNQVLKFDLLLRRARELEADFLATGHYAVIEQDGQGGQVLRKGQDESKDQSYFLFTLTQEQMARVRFPLGSMSKDEVRGHAARFDLPVAEKAESQDICFVPDGDYVRFLEEERGAGRMDGEIVHVSGKVLGRHRGTYRYTVGQRRGLGIAWPEPLFVVGIDAEKHQVVVGEKVFLERGTLIVERCNWHIPVPPQPLRAACRIRYRHQEVPAVITPLADGRAEVHFDESQLGVTPGQAAVFYDEDRVLGGGWIL